MSVPVDLDALEPVVAELGPEALLATVTADATPHVVSVLVAWEAGVLVMGAGRRTTANLAANPAATLVFPTVLGGGYRLIVDGTGAVDGDALTLTPTAAILHRVADAPGDGPTCLPV